jgi:hypothetical protein
MLLRACLVLCIAVAPFQVLGPLARACGVTTLCRASAGLGLAASLRVLFVKDVWRLRPAEGLAAAPAAGDGPSPPPAAPPSNQSRECCVRERPPL